MAVPITHMKTTSIRKRITIGAQSVIHCRIYTTISGSGINSASNGLPHSLARNYRLFSVAGPVLCHGQPCCVATPTPPAGKAQVP